MMDDTDNGHTDLLFVLYPDFTTLCVYGINGFKKVTETFIHKSHLSHLANIHAVANTGRDRNPKVIYADFPL